MATKPVVLVVGGSGETGRSIVNGLLEKGDFVVRISTRPASVDNLHLVEFKRRGAEIVLLDLTEDTDEQYVTVLRGVHTVICSLTPNCFNSQLRFVEAALKAGVKRFVPSEWGTPGRRGVRGLHDEKLQIREYVKKSGIPYTFIDVGFWFQFHLPFVKQEQTPVAPLWEASRIVYDGGNTKAAHIDIADIGRFAARIIADERTLNQYVFVNGGQFTQNELVQLAEEVSGHKVEVIHKTAAELDEIIETSKNSGWPWLAYYYEYHKSLWALGEDTEEKAVLPEYGGAILGVDLYPDFVPRSIRDYATEFYAPYKA